MEKDVEYLKEGQDRMHTKLDDFISSANVKFAEKEVEEEVKALKEAQNKINVTLAKYAGALVVLAIAIPLILKYVFKI